MPSYTVKEFKEKFKQFTEVKQGDETHSGVFVLTSATITYPPLEQQTLELGRVYPRPAPTSTLTFTSQEDPFTMELGPEKDPIDLIDENNSKISIIAVTQEGEIYIHYTTTGGRKRRRRRRNTTRRRRKKRSQRRSKKYIVTK
jgi:hypothetical protein